MLKIILLGLVISSSFAVEKTKVYSSEGQKFTYENLLEERGVIWGFDFINQDKIIFTEREGKIGILDLKSKKVSEVSGAPKVYAVGQGGLLDIRVHPTNGKIYLTYSEPMGKDLSVTSMAEAKLLGTKLTGFKKLFSANRTVNIEAHYGSRIEFDGKGHIFISSGERYQKEEAQKLSNHQGKIIRINEDGSVPKDNPFVGKKEVRAEIWSYGHRNPQGLYFDQDKQELWEAEFGPQGGDEINYILPGKNYGWPEVTYGIDYNGSKIGQSKPKTGMEEPITFWSPSISPSAMTIYKGSVFPKWKGDIFLATLSSSHIHRVVMKDRKVLKQEEFLNELNYRMRNIREGRDGLLYYSTDEGKIGRIIPMK